LPALALAPAALPLLRREHDVVVSFEPLTVAGEEFVPPTDDPFIAQELCETLYHVLWELVHVFFEHLERSSAGAGASAFLYPFLEPGQAGNLGAVVADVRESVLMKGREVAALRAQTLLGCEQQLVAAAADVRRSLDDGGKVLAFGNGGSATDAMDLVADLRCARQGWPERAAVDLTADSAILTALANDIGPEVLFQRQIIAYGRPGDVAIALSTSGSSSNILAALAEARRRGLVTIAFVGYDGGRVAAEERADYVIVSPSEHIPRIQEAQASAYHVLRELVESEAAGPTPDARGHRFSSWPR
jgi:D-sedoheptulose 7-phosphate isomerase